MASEFISSIKLSTNYLLEVLITSLTEINTFRPACCDIEITVYAFSEDPKYTEDTD